MRSVLGGRPVGAGGGSLRVVGVDVAVADAANDEAPDDAEVEVEVFLPPDLTDAARELFGERLGLAEEYARALATAAVLRGLIGPREAPRLWERHLLNCAAAGALIPTGASVIDVGSGAGLPGIVLAVARPDLSVVLVEPSVRRTTFLTEMVEQLGLTGTRVVRGRAEECRELESTADVVTARAVAPLDRLVAWCLPLAKVGRRLLALKGATAAAEVAAHAAEVRRLGGGDPMVRECRPDLLTPPTTVVEVVRVGSAPMLSARPHPAVDAAARRARSGPGSGRPRRGDIRR